MPSLRIPFNELPQSTRERLAASLTDEKDRAAVFWAGGSRDWPLVKLFFAVAGVIAAGVIMNWLSIEDARKDPWFDREVYWALAGVSFVGSAALLGFVFRLVWKPPAWKWGVQMVTGAHIAWLGLDEVDLVPVEKLMAPLITNHYRNGVYRGATLAFSLDGARLGPRFTLSLANQAAAEKVIADMGAASRRFQDAASKRDELTLKDVDPFSECTLSGKWRSPSTAGPTVTGRPALVKWGGWLAALALGVGVSYGYYLALRARCETLPRCSIYHR